MLLTLTGHDIATSLMASDTVDGAFRPLRKYNLKRINLIMAACPAAICRAKENQAVCVPIVVEKNRRNIGAVQATGYVPPAIVVSGEHTRRALLAGGIIKAYAWVDAGLEIEADDEISCEELSQKLNALIIARFFGNGLKYPQPAYQNQPYILHIYPFENYFIYDMKGQKYRQGFTMDPVERKVALSGGSVAVDEKFVNAESDSPMPFSQSGQRPSWNTVRPANTANHPGGRDCDIVGMMVRNFANINEAVSMYLGAIKTGNYKPLTPSFSPVKLSDSGHILSPVVTAGIAPLDFARWAAMEANDSDYKTVGGDKVHRSQFAYVGDPKDKSTWHLPTDTPGRARDALARINQTQGIPKNKKAGVLLKIRHKAKKHGISVSPKPTSKQKDWKACDKGMQPVR